MDVVVEIPEAAWQRNWVGRAIIIKTHMHRIKNVLHIFFNFYTSANCKCKSDTCTVEQSESERWSGWRPLASILGDAAAAFGCVNRVEELVKQLLRGTVAQFLARPSI